MTGQSTGNNISNQNLLSEKLYQTVYKLENKFGRKVMVWGAMSYSGFSDLHIVPQRQNVDGEYYCTSLLEV